MNTDGNYRFDEKVPESLDSNPDDTLGNPTVSPTPKMDRMEFHHSFLLNVLEQMTEDGIEYLDQLGKEADKGKYDIFKMNQKAMEMGAVRYSKTVMPIDRDTRVVMADLAVRQIAVVQFKKLIEEHERHIDSMLGHLAYEIVKKEERNLNEMLG